ncbi:helix-turn-helix domain-containing protein [Bacillus sp. BRMEA1]|uniref:helix-turn-helix transcriptional regulator n=1 Tax=Neobacillus endophyticus TaxID=2738405 RepID=UPI0015647C34|nr:helix-turn-helix transcriptional regulator [Neobacillus endophyticus]NRD81150.1 helix-turn-helix domain-containing protein [Neobacillus endophyticus]
MFFSGERLKVARKCTFKTIDNLIKTLESQYNLKINKGMVSRWENGKATPRDETIKILAKCLNVPIDYLTGRDSMANYLIHQRLLNNMTVEQLSQKCEISVETIQYAESDRVPLSLVNLRKIGNVYENVDFVNTILEKGISDMFPSVSPPQNTDMEFEELELDLNDLLDSNYDIVFKNRLLTRTEKEKIKKVIEVLLS